MKRFSHGTISCLNCHGTGYLVAGGYGTLKHPIKCQGCQGTGIQKVAS